MPRLVLPTRRPSTTVELTYFRADGNPACQLVTIGFDAAPPHRPREIFLAAQRSGSDMDAMLADFAVAVSVALQSGVQAQAMAKSISRVPEAMDGPSIRPASVFGAVLDLLSKFEKGEL